MPDYDQVDYDDGIMPDYDEPSESTGGDVKMEDASNTDALPRSGGFAPIAKDEKNSGLRAISEQVCEHSMYLCKYL